MKIRRMLLTVSAFFILAFCGLAAAYYINRFSLNFPTPQIVNEEHNICLKFEDNPGSGEFAIMLTYYCNLPVKRNLYGLHDPSTYLDMKETMECARIEVADKDNDGHKEIYLVQDSFCKEFAHPWGKDPKRLTFRIDADGRFIEIAREE